MTCPDPIVFLRATSLEADPELVAHLKSCPSCQLDWQIQQAVGYALSPERELPPGLNERALARIERKARQEDEVRRWWDFPIQGALVATTIFAASVAGGGDFTTMPVGPAAIWAVLAGTGAAFYTRYRDLAESHEAVGAT